MLADEWGVGRRGHGRSVRVGLAMAVAVLCGACGSHGKAAHARAAGRARTHARRRPVNAAARPSAGPHPPPIVVPDLGFEIEPPSTAWEKASAKNVAALRLHHAGRFAEARAGFEAALALDPAYDLARFNLACASSRLGDEAAAAREIAKLIARDTPRFTPKLHADSDLASLRGSPEGAALEAKLGAIEHAWATVVAGGLPASYVAPEIGGVRYGVYVPSKRRFVPAAAEAGSADAVLDRGHHRVAFIESGVVGDIEADETLTVTGVGVTAFGILGGPYRHAHTDWARDVEPDMLQRLIDPTGDWVRFLLDHWTVIAGAGIRRSTASSPAPQRLDERPPSGFALEGNALRVPGAAAPIALGPGHGAAGWHSFARSPDGTALVVASERVEGEHYVAFEEVAHAHRTFFDHVDLRTRAVTRLAVANSGGFVIAHGADLYLVMGTEARRYSGFSPARFDKLPSGVMPLPVF